MPKHRPQMLIATSFSDCFTTLLLTSTLRLPIAVGLLSLANVRLAECPSYYLKKLRATLYLQLISIVLSRDFKPIFELF